MISSSTFSSIKSISSSSSSSTDSSLAAAREHKHGGYFALTTDLEALAESLQKELVDKKLIKNQHNKSLFTKTIPKAFRGKDAVDILQNLLRHEEFNAVEISRQDAMQTGKQIMERFKFFKHVSSSSSSSSNMSNITTTSNAAATTTTTTNKLLLLLDTPTDFYQFDQNLPSQVKRVHNKYKTDWDIVRLLEQHIKCKDRSYMLRSFSNCFVAKEAVDVMMDLKLVKSRAEAVSLMKQLNQTVFCCEHVCSEHEFKDDYLFFEFIPHNQRMPEPPGGASSKSKRLLASPKSSRKESKKDISSPDMKRKKKGHSKRRLRDCSDATNATVESTYRSRDD